MERPISAQTDQDPNRDGQGFPRSWSREFVDLARLALPLSIVQVGYHLTGLVDTALAGRVDELTVAATGLGSAAFFVVSIFGVGVALGVDPLAAQAFGAGNWRGARAALWQGLYLAGIITLPLTLLMLLAVGHLELFGISAQLADQTQNYVLGRVGSLFPLLACVTLRSFLQAARTTRPVVVATIATNIFNLGADWLLLFGDAGLQKLGLPAVGLPSFGVAGIGWASTIASLAQLAVLVVAVRGIDTPNEPPIWRKPEPKKFGRIFSLGWPVGLQLAAEFGVFAGVGLLMGGIGTRAMAAHQVALMLASLSFSVCLGIGAASSVQVGRAVGRGDPVATRRAGIAGISLGVGFMMLPAIAMWTIPESLARIMTDRPDIIPAAGSLLRIAAVFQLVDGAQAVAGGALRGAGITRWPLVANLIGHWCIGLPIGAALAYGLDLQAKGLWWGLTAGLAAVAVALTAKFIRASRRPIAIAADLT